MIPTEHDALALLDQRMRSASTELRSVVARLLGESSVSSNGAHPVACGETIASTRFTGGGVDDGSPTDPHGHDAAVVVTLDAGHPSTPSTGRRRTWLVAAAIAVLAGLVGIVLARGDHEEGRVTSDGSQPFLVPGPLPDEWFVDRVLAGRESSDEAALESMTVVYGDVAAVDPWARPYVVVSRVVGPDAEGLGLGRGGERFQVNGRSGSIEQIGDSWQVELAIPDGWLTLRGSNVGRDTIVAAAEAATEAGPATVATTLGRKLDEMARGPLHASWAGWLPALGESALGFSFSNASISNATFLLESPGDADDVELLRAFPVGNWTAESTTVRGHHALMLRGPGGVMLQWLEPPGLLISAGGSGMNEAELRALVEGLRSAGDDEIDRLVEAHGLGGLSEGDVVVAEGQRGGQPWRLVARGDGGSYGLSFVDATGSTGSGYATPDELADRFEFSIADRGESGGAGDAVFGFVPSTAAQVTVEVDGQSTAAFDVRAFQLEGVEGKAFVGFVPSSLSGAQVVARDSAGVELARRPLDRLP